MNAQLKSRDGKAAIDSNGLAGGIRQAALSHQADCRCDIGRNPPAFRRNAFGDEHVVFLFHGPSHFGVYDARTDFINSDSFSGESDSKKLRCHARGTFGNAVLATGDGDRHCIAGSDVDYAAMLSSDFALLQHISRDTLTQEENRPGVHTNAAVETVACNVQKITALRDTNARIVHQAIDAPPA